MSLGEQRRERFEQAVIDRMKEGGFLEVEIRVECLQRDGDGYYDGSVDAYWHFWNAALDGVAIELPVPQAPTAIDYAVWREHDNGESAAEAEAEHAGQVAYRIEAVAAIEAAGVQVKP